jgi:hypothetical protein
MSFVRIGIYAGLALGSLAAIPNSAMTLENLNGTVRLSGVLQEMQQEELRSLDQQYMINYSRSFLPYLRGRFSFSYHDLQSRQTLPGIPPSGDSTSDGWRGELQPSADISWVNPFFSLGGNYRYREVRDFAPTNESLTRGAGAVFKTRFSNLPQSTVQYNWNDSRINSGLIPQNSVERRFQYSADWAYKTASGYYAFTNLDVENRTLDVGFEQQQHVARLDYSGALFQDRFRFSGGYLFNYRIREETGGGVLPATSIPIQHGLYAHDDTPAAGALDTLDQLMDGNTTTATTPAINIGGSFERQNVGFDLGFARQIDLIYIYTDTLSDEALDWDVYSSSDNLNWTLLISSAMSAFNLAFQRYEIRFDPANERYFKVVNSGLNEIPEVYITEIQALTTAEPADAQDQSENHRVDLNASWQAHRTVRLGFDAALGSVIEEQTSQQRHEANLAASLNYRPTPKFASTAKVQHSLTNYVSEQIPLQENDIYSLVFLFNPQKTLEASLSGSHMRTREDEQEIQRTTSSLLHLSALLLKNLSAVSEFGFSRDNRPLTDLETDTWTYRLAADANPYRNLNVVVNYASQTHQANQEAASSDRQELATRFSYRMTATLSVRGGVLWGWEDQYRSREQDWAASWNLTERISLNAGARLEENNAGNESNWYNLNAAYFISNLSSAFFTYSLNRIEEPQEEETISYQIGFYTGF